MSRTDMKTVRDWLEPWRPDHVNYGATVCHYCGGEGTIETDNNGPIVLCPICTNDGDHHG